jgi:cytochrome c oxidase subunit 2
MFPKARKTFRLWSVLAAVGASATLNGCAGPLSALDPAGPAAQSIATLWWVMLAGAAVLFTLVISLFSFAFLRRDSTGKPRRSAGKRFVLWGGLVMPSVVLTGLLGYALILGEWLAPRPDGGVLRVEAKARQWQWDFTYPEAPDAPGTSDVLHIPAGRPVDIHVTSADVIHSFWVPRLGGKIDAIPGHANVIRLFADRPGTYHGQCSEFCGTGHAVMGFSVEAHEAVDYPVRLAASQASALQVLP